MKVSPSHGGGGGEGHKRFGSVGSETRAGRGGGERSLTYEMAPHDGCCAHDHDCDAENCGAMWCLHQYIDTDKVRLFSETERERERERVR